MDYLKVILVIFVLLSVVIHLLLWLSRTVGLPPPRMIRGTVARMSYSGDSYIVGVNGDNDGYHEFIDFDGDPVKDFKVGDRVTGALLCWLQHEKRR